MMLHNALLREREAIVNDEIPEDTEDVLFVQFTQKEFSIVTYCVLLIRLTDKELAPYIDELTEKVSNLIVTQKLST